MDFSINVKKDTLKLASTVVLLSSVLFGCSTTPDSSEGDQGFIEPESTENKTTNESSTFGANSGSDVQQTVSNAQVDTKAALLKHRVILFDFDSASIKADFYPILKAHAAHLKKMNKTTIRLEGHADERGTREYNMALGERRANAVISYLRSQGVASSQLEAVSFGEEKPADYGHNEQAWSKNRRVVVRY